MPGAHTPENGNRNTVLLRRGSADNSRKHSTTRPVKSKPGTLSGTRPSAIAEFSS